MRILLTAVSSLLAAVAIAVVPTSAAQAATVWDEGYQISPGPTNTNAIADIRWSKGDCLDLGLAYIRAKGDYLWIRDTCADGHSAFAEFKVDSGHTYICRNNRGKGSIVECNFEWPERAGTFLGGISEGRTVLYRDFGNSLRIYPSGGSCSRVVCP